MGNTQASNAILAKARAMYGRRLTARNYQELLNCRDLPDLISYLKTRTSYSEALQAANPATTHRAQLETLLRFDGLPDSVEVVTTEGEKLVAAVANSPKALSPVALGRYDSLKELGWDFNDEDPESPIMSGQCATLQNNGEIVLEPLVCQVVIAAISNSMDDYELVETGLEGREDKDCSDPQPAKGNKEARKDKVRKAIKESKKKSAKGSRGRSGRKDRK